MAIEAGTREIAPSLERLAEEMNALLGYLPLLAVALVVLLLAWLLGSWLSRRKLVGRIARRNPFMQDLARTTVRWVVMLAGLLVALEILNATALVGAVLGTAGVLGVALGFAFKDILENYLAGLLMSLRQPFSPRAQVMALGDFSVKLRFFGWVDQRSHDFGIVTGEAIRRVKLALEHAGVDMPEQTYRVQVSNQAPAAAPAPAPPASTESESAVDTRARDDIDRQIDQEQRETSGENLLDPSAPRE